MRPIAATGQPASLAARAKASVSLPDRRQHLVIIAAGQDRGERIRLQGQPGAGGVRQGHARCLDLGASAGGAAELVEITDQPVRHIHRRVGMREDRGAQRKARPWHSVAIEQHRGEIGREAFRRSPARDIEPERGIPDGARHEDGIADAGPARAGALPCGTVPIAVTEIDSGPGVDTVSPPSSGTANSAMSARRPAAKPAIQASSQSPGSISVSKKPLGSAPLAARSERLTRSALAAIAPGGSSAKKWTPATSASVVSTRSRPSGRAQHRDIVHQAARRPLGDQRREMSGDQRVFGRAAHVQRLPSRHSAQRRRQGAISIGRSKGA